MNTSNSSLTNKARTYINDAVLIYDVHHKLVFVSPGADGLLGLAGGTLLQRGHEVFERVHLNGEIGSIKDLLSGLKDVEQVETEAVYRPEGGAEIPLGLTASRLQGDSGVMGSLLVMRDLVRSQTLEQQVLQSQQLELADNLSGGITHEFRNLLTVVMAYATLVQGETRGTPWADTVDKLLENAKHANELAGHLQSVTRRQSVKLEDVDPARVIDDVSVTFRKSLKKNLHIYTPEHTDLPMVHADRSMLYRALFNLCLNARDATDDGGTVTIETNTVIINEQDAASMRPTRKPGRYITISVTDNGEGMSEDVRARMFDPFYTTREGHTGLGLSAVQHTLNAMKGWITCYTEQDLGTCIRLYLPSLDLGEAACLQLDPSQTARKGTVLAVDDDPLALSLVRDFLVAAGYTVLEAAGGQQALQIFSQRCDEIDVVVLDIVMPRLNGGEVYRRMKELKPETAILPVSGFSREMAQELLGVSVSEFLEKPFVPSALYGAIDNLMKN